jgi:hypothetical protein
MAESTNCEFATDRFDHPEFLFEPKIDGFRALAYVRGQQCEMVSRNGHVFTSWRLLAADIARVVKAHNAILDGENAACSLVVGAISTAYCSGGITRTFTRSTCSPWTVRTSALCRSSSGSDDCAASCRKSTPGSYISIRSLSADAALYRAAGRGSGRKSALANPYLNIGFYHLHSLSFRFCPPQAKRQRANQFRSTRSLTLNEALNLCFVAVSIRHRRHER